MVVWLNDGVVVDCDFIGQLETIEEVVSRTSAAFVDAKSAR